MTAPPLVLYHAGCTDGLAAAWAVRHAYAGIKQPVECVPVKHGQLPPDVRGRRVIIVDFSYPRETLLQMVEVAESIEVYDHHKTAKADLEGLEDAHDRLYTVFDMERSGAGIAWDEHLSADEGEPRPWFIDVVEDNDLWRFKYPSTKAMVEYIRSWPQTVDVFDSLWGVNLSEAIIEGQAILRHKQVMVEQAAAMSREVSLLGETARVANVPYFLSSEVANALIGDNRVGITYYEDQDRRLNLSFRSTDGHSAGDLAVRCRALPGCVSAGGHGNSAGAVFQAGHLPFLVVS